MAPGEGLGSADARSGPVAVICLGADVPVAACGCRALECTLRRAAITARDVPVVARLAGADDSVPASGRRAIGVAPVALDEIPVVTRLPDVDDAVAADAGCRCDHHEEVVSCPAAPVARERDEATV